MSSGGKTQMQAATPVGVSETLSVQQIEERLHARYQSSGLSHRTWENDRALYRRVCRAAGHPSLVTTDDMETIVLSAHRIDSRAMYVERFQSVWQRLRELGLIAHDLRPDEALPHIRRSKGLPRPLSPEQEQTLLLNAREPMRSWFVLGLFAGLRAMEVSALRGVDLEDTAEGSVLRIVGKGRVEATIPAHPMVVEVIRNEGRLGRLYQYVPHMISRKASAEMRRLGVNATFHACRHTFATRLLAAGNGDITVVSQLLRHGSIATSMRYTKIAEDKPRAVLAALTMPFTPPPPRTWGGGNPMACSVTLRRND